MVNHLIQIPRLLVCWVLLFVVLSKTMKRFNVGAFKCRCCKPNIVHVFTLIVRHRPAHKFYGYIFVFHLLSHCFCSSGKERERAVFHKVYVFMEINHWFLRHLVWNFLQMLLCKSHLLFALIDYGFRLCSHSIQLNFVSHLAVSHIKCIHTYTHID